ncbi:MAG: hypothetical protein ACLFPP_05140 [Spirochaetaceae bacterium]
MRHISVAELLRLPRPFAFLREKAVPTPVAVERELYQPPVVAVVEEGRSLLWGRETVRVAREAGRRELWCRELKGTEPLEAAKAALAAENRPGEWELDELVALLAFIEGRGAAPDEPLRELIDGSKRGLLEQARKAASLPKQVRELVLRGALTLRHGEELAQLPAPLAEAVVAALGEGSFSTRRELVRMSVELFKRYQEEDPGIEARLIEALGSADPRRTLYALRYPSYSGARETLDSFRSRFLKGTGVRLEEPPYLEGDSFSLVIPFSTPRELEKRLDAVRRAAKEIEAVTELLG